MPTDDPGINEYWQRVSRKLLATEGPSLAPAVRSGQRVSWPFGAAYQQWERQVYRFISRHEAAVHRALEALPGLLTWGLILFPFLLAEPAPLAPMLLAIFFQIYWLRRALGTLIYGCVGLARVRVHGKMNWRARYGRDRAAGVRVHPWGQIRHLVIIPSYNEPVGKLRACLESLARQQQVASRITAILAMEGREQGSAEKAQALQQEFAGRLAVYYTVHPDGLPGEAAIKAANSTWAARWAWQHLVNELGWDPRDVVLTTCDVDSVFHPRYFACLTYKFATDAGRYLRIWQAPLLFHNNVWQVPTFVRFSAAIGATAQLAGLCDVRGQTFPLSTYSASLALIDGVGYWDVDVIPDDWHMYLKCYFRRHGRVTIEPIYLPVLGDAPLSHTLWRTAINHYEQLKRHAWGVCDLPYAIRMYFQHVDIPAPAKLLRLWALAREHLIRSSSWPVITFGTLLPYLLSPGFAVSPAGLLLSRIAAAIGIAGSLLSPGIVLIDFALQPPKPLGRRWWQGVWAALQWPLMPVFMLIFGTLPAIEAQTRLMLGHKLAYRVTEKV